MIAEIIFHVLKMFVWISIGTTIGFAFGIVIGITGFTETLSKLPGWMTTLLILLISSGTMALMLWFKPDGIEQIKEK